MTIYAVIRKSDGQQVYEYQSGSPVEWHGMEFATHDHVVMPDPAVEPAPDPVGVTLTRLEYLRRFTDTERKTIRAAARVNDALDDYLYMLEMAEEVRTDDPVTMAGVHALEAAGLIGVGRAAEILA